MRKKFWITFFVAMAVFSAIFVKVSPYFSDNGSMASVEDLEEDIKAQEIVEEKGEILFLLMGIDDEYSNGGVEKVKEKRDNSMSRYFKTALRSDTMILCKFDFDTGETTMLSIPRDTKTRIRGRKNEEKINHAHSYGGPNLSVDAVRDLLDVDLDYYVTVDFRAVETIVDAIGGVDLYIPRDMKYTDSTKGSELYIDFKKGQQKLDGKKALEYLRFRSYPEGDLGRVKAQQYFLKEFAKQMLKPKNIMNLPKIVKSYFDYVDTNIPFSVVMKGLGSANKVDIDGIEMLTVPGEATLINGISYFIYDENEMRTLMREKFGNFLLAY